MAEKGVPNEPPQKVIEKCANEIFFLQQGLPMSKVIENHNFAVLKALCTYSKGELIYKKNIEFLEFIKTAKDFK